MSVGQRQRFLPGGWRARVRQVAATVPEVHADRTLPRIPAVADGPGAGEDPSILGFPAELGADGGADEEPEAEPVTIAHAAHTGRLVVVRRSDTLGGVFLVLAGVAAGLSLWLPWVRGRPDIGLAVIRQSFDVALADASQLTRTAVWEPLAVVLGGGLLFLLGMLLFIPASTHRFVGLLAFVVAEVAAAGILTGLAATGWSTARFDVGMWCAVAVPVLGVLGALKAMLTAPRLPALVSS